MASESYTQNVFINCPFDTSYKEFFIAILFVVKYCDFKSRCAFEIDNGATVRLEKIYALIDDCQLAIHDISRTELNANKLPRFNMPLELGIFLGAKRYGTGRHRQKNCIILDTAPHRFQEFISDIGGQDITPHENDVGVLIVAVRNWLHASRPRSGNGSTHATVPGGDYIHEQYNKFDRVREEMCMRKKLILERISYHDWIELIDEWLVT